MPTFIAAYDLEDTYPSPYDVFLEQAAERGWSTWIQGTSGKWYRLPNTTLVGEFDSMDAAVAELKASRAATQLAIGVSVSMEKWVVSERRASRFDSDETEG